MFCVIMAGGSGTRFWPASLRRMPKQFLDITGKGPMVVETCRRLAPISREDEQILVIAREHSEEAARLFAGRRVHILAEPVGRNTAPCIGLGALYAEQLGCSGPIAFLPADHFISDANAFLKAVELAGSLAGSGAIVTLGIMPTRPETGYGYIKRSGEQIEGHGGHAYRVSAFVEKPDPEKARQYVSGGEHYWNAGIFVATAGTILREIKTHLPGLHHALERLKSSIPTSSFEREMESVYPALESVSFDYGIMEKTGCPSLVVPCECGWSDVGSWESLHELKNPEHDSKGNFSEGESLLIDCEGSHVSSRGGKMVACLGLKNCLVVDTPDALLVADLHRSQDIKKIIEKLKAGKKERLL
ncbi:MAG: nucleotidyl transferase [Desulfobacteraceae bacterium]|nr:MAG: nucleotidyl transferase [Desulfobacteraceae bacterium]